MSDNEVICLDDDTSDIDDVWLRHAKKESLREQTEGSYYSPVVLISESSSDEDPAPVPVKKRKCSKSKSKSTSKFLVKPNKNIKKKETIFVDEEELPDVDSDEDSFFSSTGLLKAQRSMKKHTRTENNRKAKIKLPKKLHTSPASTFVPQHKDLDDLRVPLSRSPSSSVLSSTPNSSQSGSLTKSKSPKKKKTLADIVTDLHETSTDEIDSDEINASQQKLAMDPSPRDVARDLYGSSRSASTSQFQTANDEPQPCCSKSLQPMSYKVTETLHPAQRKKHELISSDSDEELLDIDYFPGASSCSQNAFKTHVPLQHTATTKSATNGYAKNQSVESTKRATEPYGSSSQSSAVSWKPSTLSSEVSSTERDKKRQQKAVEAERKKQEKDFKKLEREKKKADEAREKELKRVENELRRNTKPGEAVRFITLMIDQEIVKKIDSLVPQFVAAEINYDLKFSPLVENSITFQRELVHQAMGDNLQVEKVSKFQEEDQMMIVVESNMAIPMIHAHLSRDEGINEDIGIDIISWVESIKDVCPTKKLTIFFYDIEKYFRKLKRSTQQDFRNRVLNADDDQPQKKRRKQKKDELPNISRPELESVLIQLQLQTGVNYRMIKDAAELGTCIIQYTKAIADAPFKKQRIESHQGFDWFALMDCAGSVRVEKDGAGLRRLWIDQLQQFNTVGPDIANAIVNKYPSPTALIEAYRKCQSVEEGEDMLKDMLITNGVGVLARTRRLGPELSKKMYRFFTSSNGDRFLGSTSDMR